MGTPCKHYRPSLDGHTATYTIGPQVCPWCKIESLESKLAALEADARRYRKLKLAMEKSPQALQSFLRHHNWIDNTFDGGIDEAIDFALSQEPAEGG